jgi:hypothetical protein
MLGFALVFLQLVVSVRPGLVNVVNGEANVRQYQQVPVGKTISTSTHGHVEFSLGWDAFLRLDENSSATLETADIMNVAVRIESGTGLV